MKAALMACASWIALASAPLGEEHGGKVDWVRDAEFGVLKAKLDGKAAMLYFTATW